MMKKVMRKVNPSFNVVHYWMVHSDAHSPQKKNNVDYGYDTFFHVVYENIEVFVFKEPALCPKSPFENPLSYALEIRTYFSHVENHDFVALKFRAQERVTSTSLQTWMIPQRNYVLSLRNFPPKLASNSLVFLQVIKDDQLVIVHKFLHGDKHSLMLLVVGMP